MSDERNWAAIAHLTTVLNLVFFGLAGPLAAGLIWLVYKEKSRWVVFHALQALAYQGFLLVLLVVIVGGTWMLGFIFSFATFGIGAFIAVPAMILSFCLGGVILFGGALYAMYAAYQVYQGSGFRYPWIADWIEQT
jgi:hypothetical protein